jgi:hypothetical protein
MLSLFFNSGPKKALFLSLDVNCDQQTHKKWCLQFWHQCEQNYPTKSHNNSADVPCWGIAPIDWSWFLLGSRGFLWVWIMGSQNVMSLGYGSNISDIIGIRLRHKPVTLRVCIGFNLYSTRSDTLTVLI